MMAQWQRTRGQATTGEGLCCQGASISHCCTVLGSCSSRGRPSCDSLAAKRPKIACLLSQSR